MGLNEFPPQPRKGLMTKQPPCAPWPAASFNQGIWHLPALLWESEERACEKVKKTGMGWGGQVKQLWTKTKEKMELKKTSLSSDCYLFINFFQKKKYSFSRICESRVDSRVCSGRTDPVLVRVQFADQLRYWDNSGVLMRCPWARYRTLQMLTALVHDSLLTLNDLMCFYLVIYLTLLCLCTNSFYQQSFSPFCRLFSFFFLHACGCLISGLNYY